jgi:glc operon protein GlcG
MIPTRILLRVFVVLGLVSCGPPSTPARGEKQAPPAAATAPLVSRERIRLNLAGAEVILAASKKKAAALELKENIAVVDDGGHLLAFARMDGARPASGYTAMTKAVTAATFRQATGPLPPKGEPNLLLNLSLQNAALASGGKLTTLKGGVPVVVDGQVIGAVGVGGGTGEQDAEVAKAGIEALVRVLEAKK